jgi:RNA polymerase-binding transcription factor DksA
METLELGRFAETTEEATRVTELHTELALRNMRKEPAESALYCVECDAEIPEARRKILYSTGGTKLCVHCQSMAEMSGRHTR